MREITAKRIVNEITFEPAVQFLVDGEEVDVLVPITTLMDIKALHGDAGFAANAGRYQLERAGLSGD